MALQEDLLVAFLLQVLFLTQDSPSAEWGYHTVEVNLPHKSWLHGLRVFPYPKHTKGNTIGLGDNQNQQDYVVAVLPVSGTVPGTCWALRYDMGSFMHQGRGKGNGLRGGRRGTSLAELFGAHTPPQFWKSLWAEPAGLTGPRPGVALANLEFQSSCLEV